MHVYLEKSDIGATLSTWFYCAMWQLYSAEQSGHQGYIHWPQGPGVPMPGVGPMRSLEPHQDPAAFARQPNMFEWYCVQPRWKGPGLPPRELTWVFENTPELSINPHCLGLDFARSWYQNNLIWNQDVINRAESIIQKYGIDFSNTLGLSWRGCDSVMDGRPRQPIETYFPHIDAILEKEPNLRIFATAEETSVVDKVKARYPNVFEITEFFSAPWGYTGHSEYVNPSTGYERGMQTCCMIYILSRCKHYIKNRSSQSYVAAWLSKGNVICMHTLEHQQAQAKFLGGGVENPPGTGEIVTA